jgi:DNA-directed RNA polymerase specialized sigma24 family protein
MASGGTKRRQAADPAVVATNFNILLHEADAGAKRLARRFDLSTHDRDDIRHELLVDLLVRAQAFAPSRGSLGAFAGTIIRHRSSRIGHRIRRENRFFADMPKSRTFTDAEGAQIDSPQENAERTHENLTNEAAIVETRIDLQRALASLSSSDIGLCGALIDHTPTEISRSSGRSRASIYRAIKKIRTHIVDSGISIAA